MTIKIFRQSRSLGDTVFCSICLEKQQKIDRLEEEIVSLKAKLRYRSKKDSKEFFGSSTPSSQKKFKEKSTEENQNKKGGAVSGHKNNPGRKLFGADQADEIIDYNPEFTHCPCCNVELKNKEVQERSVLEGEMLKPKKILFRNQIKRCPKCHKTYSKQLPVLKKHKYGTKFISNSAIMHYLHGIPLKRVEDLWGNDVVSGNLIKIFHRIANVFEPAIEQFKKDYRNADVLHADETSWRTDGTHGYAWMFSSKNTSLFAFRETRSSSVAKEFIGNKSLDGVLVVDRYAGYNKAPCSIQLQNIFRKNEHRLFHWVKNRLVPADNNYAERELRATVIARKVSHGSQSKLGAKTRSILMSVINTAKKRLKDKRVEEWLNEALQTYIHNPKIDPYLLLPN